MNSDAIDRLLELNGLYAEPLFRRIAKCPHEFRESVNQLKERRRDQGQNDYTARIWPFVTPTYYLTWRRYTTKRKFLHKDRGDGANSNRFGLSRFVPRTTKKAGTPSDPDLSGLKYPWIFADFREVGAPVWEARLCCLYQDSVMAPLMRLRRYWEGFEKQIVLLGDEPYARINPPVLLSAATEGFEKRKRRLV